MERMKKQFPIVCLLDACTIINLLHIDEDGRVIRSLSQLRILVCEKVFKEVQKNVFAKVGKFDRIAGHSDKLDKKQITKEIDSKLTIIRGWQILEETIKYDFGQDYFKNIAKITGYDKQNGEFYSAATALAISRNENIKLYFHTDDFPAKMEFSSFFRHQQVGYIEDTADLLVLLYRIDDKFKLKELDLLLSKLATEYNLEVAVLEKKLGQYSLTGRQVRETKRLRENLALLKQKLNQQDFTNLQEIFNFFLKHRTKCRSLCEVLEMHKSVLDLETSNSKKNLIGKIKNLRLKIKKQPIYDLEALLSA